MVTATIESMSELNTRWGICGFVSALSALFQHSPQKRQLELSSAAKIETRILAEIKVYLVTLQADNRVDLLSMITTFTRSFGGQWATFDIKDYIARINASPNVSPANLGDFSIAMPPDALVDYLRRMCEFKSARILNRTWSLFDPTELILGLSSDDMNMKLHNHLAHWVYHLNGKVYSWGQECGPVPSFLTSHKYSKVVYKIAIT